MSAGQELDRRQPLFDARVPVTVRAHGSSADDASPGEGQRRGLTVRVLHGTRVALGQRERLLHLELTDDGDPFFLYTLDVSEDGFHRLKHDQSLHVEFAGFPPSFIELLQACGAAEPRFTAVLDVGGGAGDGGLGGGGGVFSIVETNQFKNLTHLSLRFRAGTDASIKAYLASRLQQFQAHNAELGAELSTAQAALEQATTAGDETRAALDALRARHEGDAANVSAQHAADRTRQEADFNQRMAEAQQQAARDLRDMQERHESGTRDLRTRAEKLEAERADMIEARTRAESAYMQLQASHGGIVEEVEALRAELLQVRERNRELDATNFESEKTMSQKGAQLEALAQEIKDKSELLAQMTLRLEESAEQRAQLEDTLALLRENQERLHAKFQDSVGEINKGNAIIQRMQQENKQLRSKLKLKSKVLRRQEELVAEKDRQLDSAHRDKLGVDDALGRAQDRIEHTEGQLERANKKLAESKQLLESNQQVIKWLNQEINQMQLTGRRGLGPSAAALGLAETDPSTGHRFKPKMGPLSSAVGTAGPVAPQYRPIVDPLAKGGVGGNLYDVAGSKALSRGAMTTTIKTLDAPVKTKTAVAQGFGSADMFGDDVPLPLQSAP